MRDDEIRERVSLELKSDEALETSQVTVTVEDGVVTLVGGVDSHAKKRHAESLVNRLEVVLPIGDQRSDEEIARAALLALELSVRDRIKVSVDGGWVTLDGTVESHEQRELAARAAGNLIGVRGLTNLIEVRELQPSP